MSPRKASAQGGGGGAGRSLRGVAAQQRTEEGEAGAGKSRVQVMTRPAASVLTVSAVAATSQRPHYFIRTNKCLATNSEVSRGAAQTP